MVSISYSESVGVTASRMVASNRLHALTFQVHTFYKVNTLKNICVILITLANAGSVFF